MNWFVPFVVLLLPSYLVRFSVAGIPTTLLEILIYGSAISLLISQPWARIVERLKPIWRKYGWPILLLLISAAIATYIAPDKRIALGLLKAYVIDPLMLFGVIAIWGQNAHVPYQRIAKALMASAFIVALTALFIKNPEGRALGLYVLDVNPSPNYVALYLAPITAFGIGLLAAKQQQTLKEVARLGLLTLVPLLAIMSTGSRGAQLAVIVSLGLAALYALNQRISKNPTVWFRTSAALLLLAALVVGLRVALPDFDANASHRATTSNNLRYEIWRTTLVDIIPAKPVTGVGLGNYQNYFTQITNHRINFPEFISPWARTPHNFFLTIWTNLGLGGLLAMIWIISRFTYDLAKAKPTAGHFALLLTLVTLLIHGLVDSAYWKNDLAALFWVIMAIGFLEARRETA